ncbi:MAG: hypothetical protein E7317_08390, partial [Clostridiales bacterium]|nr:hypothetical protein [Clostridiales bacterium]
MRETWRLIAAATGLCYENTRSRRTFRRYAFHAASRCSHNSSSRSQTSPFIITQFHKDIARASLNRLLIPNSEFRIPNFSSRLPSQRHTTPSGGTPMNTYIGIDLGTTGLKSLLVAEDGRVLGSGYRTYPISTPAPGYAEQDPQDWWEALRASLAEAMAQARASAADIRGIGLSGQMHGAVLTDADGALICPAVIWADQRSIAEAREVTRALGAEQLGLWTQNPVASGFQLSTLLWMRRHRPELYARARHVLLPKDWLRMRMTGLVGTEPTDACGTLLYDCAGRTWSAPLLRAFDIDDSLLPDCRHAAWEIQGGLTAAAADALGLRRGTPVAFGGADQPMQALGNGILSPGTASVTLGTGGQVFAPVARPVYDPALRTHTFCHAAPDTWYLMGAAW